MLGDPKVGDKTLHNLKGAGVAEEMTSVKSLMRENLKLVGWMMQRPKGVVVGRMED
jgi:hypothetical protein